MTVYRRAPASRWLSAAVAAAAAAVAVLCMCAEAELVHVVVDHAGSAALALPHSSSLPGNAPVQVGNVCNPITEQVAQAVAHIEDSYESSDNLEAALAVLVGELLLPATKYNGSAPVLSTLELGTIHIDFVEHSGEGGGSIRTWLEPCWPSVNITTALLEKKGISFTNTTQSTQANGGLWTVDVELTSSFWDVGFGYYLSSDNTEERLGRLRKFIVEEGGLLGVQFVQAIGISSSDATSAFSQLQTLFDPVKSFDGAGYWQSGAGPAVYLIRDESVVAAPGGIVNLDLRVRNFTAAVNVLTEKSLLASNEEGFATIDLPLSFSIRICSPCSY